MKTLTTEMLETAGILIYFKKKLLLGV